jgi:small subunit ribosomal protein S9
MAKPSSTYPLVGYRATGRRKCAVARVRLIKGNGTVLVNGRSMMDYLGNRALLHDCITKPLAVAGLNDRFNVLVRVHGGGIKGQADAAGLAVARCLAEINPDIKILMRANSFLTVNSRVKERKKYGLRGARKRPQYSKR